MLEELMLRRPCLRLSSLSHHAMHVLFSFHLPWEVGFKPWESGSMSIQKTWSEGPEDLKVKWGACFRKTLRLSPVLFKYVSTTSKMYSFTVLANLYALSEIFCVLKKCIHFSLPSTSVLDGWAFQATFIHAGNLYRHTRDSQVMQWLLRG